MVRNDSPPIAIDEIPLHEMIRRRLVDHGEQAAIVNGQTAETYTFRRTHDIVHRVASGVHRLGVRQTDIVMLFSPNSPEYIFALLAVVANGAAITLPSPSYTPYELSHALKLTNSSWVVTTPTLYDTVIAAAKSANIKLNGIVCFGTEETAVSDSISFSTLLSDDGSQYPNVKIDPRRDVAVILFSSGTTGLPKGVMLSHYNLVAMLALLRAAMTADRLRAAEQQQVVMAFLPLCHCFGLVGVALRALDAGYKTVVLPRFKMEEVLSCIAKYKVTIVSLVPPIIVAMSKSSITQNYDLTSVQRYSTGAAPLTAETEEEFKHKFGVHEIHQGYGMTELTMACLRSIAGKPLKFGSVGQPMVNTEVKILDVEAKNELGPNLRGEIIARGPQVMLGYINNDEATRETIDSEGWLHTGDIGYYDEEGYFYIVDRIKELIKYKGLQVAPAELESLILTHPLVADVAVIGIPDKSAGELPKAFVVVKHGSILTELQVKQFVADKVSNFKHLRGGVEFVKTIPKSESGKILRRVLRERTFALKPKL